MIHQCLTKPNDTIMPETKTHDTMVYITPNDTMVDMKPNDTMVENQTIQWLI